MSRQLTRRQFMMASGTAVTLGTAGCLGVPTRTDSTEGSDSNFEEPLLATNVHQYNAPGCSCCGQYAAYLRESVTDDLTTTVPDDIAAVKREHGVPADLRSCHTVVLEDYVVEGHVPAAVIRTLLEESPAIDGIALPGMPAGSPGMGGDKSDTFVIREFSDGEPGEIFSEF